MMPAAAMTKRKQRGVRVIRARAPLRLGLGGGGTDVSPYSNAYGGCVLSASIDLYAQTCIEPLSNGRVIFEAADCDQRFEGIASNDVSCGKALALHSGVYRRIVRQFNGGKSLSLRMTTYADAPPGSGLGTSSTLVVSMLQAYSEWLQLGLDDYEIAHLAYEIERLELGLAGGKQDQYAAAFGGFNFIEFGPGDHVLVNPLRVKQWVINELEASTVLYFTGQSRQSAHIIERQIQATQRGEANSLEAMHRLKANALVMKEAILRGDIQDFADALHQSWDSKKRLTTGISNPEIDHVYDLALQAGAVAGKLSGAGGGGFMMFLVKPELRMKVVCALSRCPGKVVNFHFSHLGAQAWTLPTEASLVDALLG